MTDLKLAGGLDRHEVLEIIPAVEQKSEHPIAQAIVRAAQQEQIELIEPAEFNSLTGYGVSAIVNGRRVLVGADGLMRREGVDLAGLAGVGASLAQAGKTPLYAAIDKKIAAVPCSCRPSEAYDTRSD